MPNQLLYYPVLQQLMDKAWNDLERRVGHRMSLRKAHTLLNTVSPSSLSSYRRGRQLPTDDGQLKKLGEFFYPDDTSAQSEFIAAVKRVGKTVDAKSLIDPYDRAAAGNHLVKVGVVNYGAYAWDNKSNKGFFDNFFSSFLRYAAMDPDLEKVDLEEAPRRLCKPNDVDVVLAILATPDRARIMKFFLTPITIYVNAVVRKKDFDEFEDNRRHKISEALTNPPTVLERGRIEIKPIVNALEVGGLYVTNYLGLKAPQYEHVSYDAQEYVRRLSVERTQDGPQVPIPVVIADELMCLEVANKCEGGAELVFRHDEPPTDDRTVLDPEILLPRYRLSFAVNRNHHKWIDFLTEILPYFLDANSEAIVKLYVDLRKRLLDSLGKRRDSDGWRVDDWLGLHRFASLDAPLSPSWNRILKRAKDISQGGESSQRNKSTKKTK